LLASIRRLLRQVASMTTSVRTWVGWALASGPGPVLG
jgi:hypothetical protein